MIIVPENSVERMRKTQEGAPSTSTTTIESAAFTDSDTSSSSSSSCVIEKTVKTHGDNFSRLDVEMHGILHSKKFTEEREKFKNYLQVLRRYLFHKASDCWNEREGELDEIDTTLSPLSDDAILESVAKALERRARLLLRHWTIAAPERLKWDNASIVTLDDLRLERSSIIETCEESRGAGRAPCRSNRISKVHENIREPERINRNAQMLKIGRVMTNPINTAK